MQIKIGCDPELFLKDPKTGAFLSGHAALPGTKADPFKVKAGAVQIDGTALEFNTDPAHSCDEFIGNINTVLDEMKRMIGDGYEISVSPVAEYEPEYFKTIPVEALELGCNPDFNAWTLDANPRPDADHMYRTGSGHIHIGWGEGFDPESEEHFMACVTAARQLDYYVGAPSLLWDPDNRRRSMYGKAGAFRPKSYGLEYRVPSNAWLRSELTRRFVYNASVKAIDDLMGGIDLSALHGDAARNIIDNNEIDWDSKYDLGIGMDLKGLRAA